MARKIKKIDWIGMALLTPIFYIFIYLFEIGASFSEKIIIVILPIIGFISLDRLFEKSGLNEKLEKHASLLNKKISKQ